MKQAIVLAVAVVTVWLQVGFLAGLAPFGVVPNLMLVVVIYAGLSLSTPRVLGLAISGGFLLDYFSGSDFGLRTAFYTVIGLTVLVLVRAGADLDKASMVLASVTAGTIIYNFLIIAGLVLSRQQIDWSLVGKSIMIEIVLNDLIALMVRPLAMRLAPRPASLRVKVK